MMFAAIRRAARRRQPPTRTHAGQLGQAACAVQPAGERAPAAGRIRAAAFALLAGLVQAVTVTLASEPGPVAPRSGATTGCCADPSQFPYESLPVAGAVNVVIDARGPSFEFQSGRSFFRAFRLPSATRSYTLEVQSFLEPSTDPRRSRVFYPVLALLTDDFLVARVTDLETLSFDLPTLERTTAPAYRVSVPIDPGNARERYVVVFTPAALFEARTLPPITTPDSVTQAARVAYLGAAPVGRLRVTVRPRADGAPAGAADAPQPVPGAEPNR